MNPEFEEQYPCAMMEEVIDDPEPDKNKVRAVEFNKFISNNKSRRTKPSRKGKRR